jgi:hypothetical protein
VALCTAIKPRPVYVPPPSAPVLEMAPELREQYIAEHRKKLADLAERIKNEAEDGLSLLKQAIAAAVADGGGDEAAELLRLDRMLCRRVAA